MPSVILDRFGIPRKVEHLRFVAELEKLKKESGSNPWPVIEKIMDFWREQKPLQWQSYLFDLGKIRDSRKDKKFASTKDKVTGGTLRYTLDLPQPVMFMIRMMYSPEELPMHRDFNLEFAKRYPIHKVAEKL